LLRPERGQQAQQVLRERPAILQQVLREPLPGALRERQQRQG
jgi:hypothetical protein